MIPSGVLIERPQWYVAKFLNPSAITGFSQFSLALQTDSDAPFRMFGIAFYVFDSSGTPQGAAGNVEVGVEFTRPDGTTFYQRHIIPAQAIQPFDSQSPLGAGGQTAPYYSYFSPLSPNQLYPPQTTITYDFQNIPLFATTRVYAVAVGTKIFRDGTVWAPKYPAKYQGLPFDGYAVQIPLGTLPVLNQPLTINPDADFVWQKGSQTDQPAASLSPVGAAMGLGIILRDVYDKSYMNDYVPIELLFGFDNSQTPGLVYPEIYIPRLQQLYMDVNSL
jgi:hypothetical protein